MLEEKVAEERDTNLSEKEDIRQDEIQEDHWRDISDEGDDKKDIHALRWEVYVKDKQELIKREFLVSVPHPIGDVLWHTGIAAGDILPNWLQPRFRYCLSNWGTS